MAFLLLHILVRTRFPSCLPGIGTALCFASVMVTVGTYFERRRGFANGILQSSASIGTLLLGPGVRYLLDEYTLKGALLIICGLCTHIIACGFALRPTTFYTKRTASTYKEKKEIHRKTSTSMHNIPHANGKLNGTLIEKPLLKEEKSHSHLTLFRQVKTDSPIFVRRRWESERGVDKLTKHYASDDTLCSFSLADLQMTELYNDQQLSTKRPSINGVVKKFFNYKILKDQFFIRMLLAYTLGATTVSLPVFYIPAYANQEGVSKQNAAILVSIYGCVDVIGRVAFGAISDTGIISKQYLIAISLSVGGIFCCLAFLCSDFWSFVVFVVLYGIIGSALPALYTATLVEELGLENLRSALLVMYMCQGIFGGTVAPLVGMYLRLIVYIFG